MCLHPKAVSVSLYLGVSNITSFSRSRGCYDLQRSSARSGWACDGCFGRQRTINTPLLVRSCLRCLIEQQAVQGHFEDMKTNPSNPSPTRASLRTSMALDNEGDNLTVDATIVLPYLTNLFPGPTIIRMLL